jgi:hypothetical protein
MGLSTVPQLADPGDTAWQRRQPRAAKQLPSNCRAFAKRYCQAIAKLVPRYCQETAIGPGESFGLLSTRLPAKGSDDGHTQSEPSQARSERSDDGDKRSEPSQPQSEPSQSAVAARAGSQEAKRGTVCFLNVAVPEGDLERKGMEDVLNPDVINWLGDLRPALAEERAAWLEWRVPSVVPLHLPPWLDDRRPQDACAGH